MLAPLTLGLYHPSLTGEGARYEREGFLTKGFLTRELVYPRLPAG